MYEYALTNGNKYRKAALSTIDYFFGRNATGYCYMTGFGTQRVMNIHHRISAVENVKKPVPGLVVGGANKGKKMLNSYQLMLPIFQMNLTRISSAAMPQTKLPSTGTPIWCPCLDG